MNGTAFETTLRDRLAAAADGAPAAPGLGATVATRARRRARVAAARRVGAGLAAVGLLAGVVVVRAERGAEVVAVPAAPAPPAGVEGWWTLADAPIEPRIQHVSVWTGSEVLVWGGNDARGGWLTDGAAWDPATDTWRELPRAPITGRSDGVAVWTGREMVVAAGDEGATVAAYDPERDEWRSLPSPPVEGVASALTYAVWTGDEVLLAGSTGGEAGGAPTVAALDPATGEWRRGADADGELPAFGDAVWTGEEMLLVGDIGGGGATLPDPVVLGYDLAADRWRELPEWPLGGARIRPAVAWTGEELVVAGGESPGDGGQRRDAAAFDPATGRWRSLPDAPVALVGSDRFREPWTGTEMIGTAVDGHRPVALDPATGEWRVGPPAAVGWRAEAPAVWTGTAVVVWGGGVSEHLGAGATSCCTPVDGGEAYQPPSAPASSGSPSSASPSSASPSTSAPTATASPSSASPSTSAPTATATPSTSAGG